MHDAGRPGKASGRGQRPAALSLAAASATLAVAIACGEGPGTSALPTAPASAAATPPEELVATHADFDGFQRWERIPLENATVPTKARPGPAAIYVNRRAPAGATSWPVGTILVKAIESGEDPRDWTVHAMVKRGALFNPTGAVGWEFFGLQLTAEGRPVILWRSEGDNDGHAYSAGLSLAAAAGRAPGAELTCIDCHTAAWQDDDVLTPALSLRAALGPR